MEKLRCFAVTLPGLEEIVAEELGLLSVSDICAEEGGVHFQATMDGVFRVNLRSRSVTRVLIRLTQFRAHSFPELFNKASKVGWERYLSSAGFGVRASAHHSKLLHTGRIEATVSDAIKKRCTLTESEKAIGQSIVVRMDDGICTISIDSSGERLGRRGYRLYSGKAPLRETMAAAILQWIGWQAEEPLLLPMCGSGTFAIEAAWLGMRRAPGLGHDFPFKHWPSFKEKRWQRILDKSEAMGREVQLQIFASDMDQEMIQQAKRNAKAATVSRQIHFSVERFTSLTPPEESEPGVIICNPPYGDRIKGDVRGLYRQLGDCFRKYFSDWRIAVIVPDQGCEHALGMPVKRRLKIKHGGKWVHLLQL